MDITIIALGSRGDIQPFLPLALGLQKAGYGVRVGTFEEFRQPVVERGLDYVPIFGDPRSTMSSQAGQAWLSSGENVFKAMRQMRKTFIDNDPLPIFDGIFEACRGSDAIIYSFMAAPAFYAAEKLGLPSIFTLVQPFTRSRRVPSMASPELPLGGGYNMLTHRMSELLIWWVGQRSVNRWLQESLDMPPVSWRGPFDHMYEHQMPYLYGFSPSVVPRPDDWPDWHHISGYWFLDRDPSWSPPEPLQRFIESGPKPISIGFGSMVGRHAQRLVEAAVEAVERSDQRAVLIGGWAQVEGMKLPDSIFKIDAVPHDWLFPRMAAVVHHGGSGTTAAGLRAGVPSVVVPFFGDQPYWGRRVHTLGVGPKPIQLKALTADKLAAAISEAISDEDMSEKAAALGTRIRTEDGVGSAVKFISSYLGN
jgi:UDP:flavonoid glycosyltransferase YjiC (YdhE family)